eukprot:g4349.t1
MRAESAAGAERRPPQWAIFVIAVIADLVSAFGFVPAQYEALLRCVVMYCLYREWGLALVCGFILPRSLPLAGVCFLKQKWLALKISAQGQLKVMAAAANGRATDRSPHMEQAGEGGNPLNHRSNGRVPGREVSGYDVSAVSGEEVVELSSWEAESKTRVDANISEARRRRPLR